MIKLSEVFAPYAVELDGSLADAAVNNIRINKERRILNIDITSDYLLTRAAIFEAQEKIAAADIGVNKVIIHPHFRPESFDVGYFDELVAALKSNTPSLNGTLNDAVLVREGEDRLNVELAHGGLALLEAKEFDTLLSDIIYREFGLRFDVRFSGVTQLSVDDEQFTESIDNAQKKIDRQKIEELTMLFEGEEISLETSLKEMASALDRVTPYFPEFEELRKRLDSSRIELRDIRDEIATRGERISYSPQRMEEVDARLSLLYSLLRKFDAETVTDLIALRADIASRLSAGMDDELDRERLQKQVDSLKAACEKAAEDLHKARVKAAPGLSGLLQERIRSLEMPRARFSVEVKAKAEAGPDGKDEIAFLFDANERGLQPLSKCGSGGELSRIMLCIKSLLAQYQGMPTLIFDEIDTGISGSVAEKMGRMIAAMGERMQVFAITHLPQVASKGTAHYLVYKETGPDGARSGIRPLEGPERVREIARMLSGSDITPEALANAAVLLQGNKSN